MCFTKSYHVEATVQEATPTGYVVRCLHKDSNRQPIGHSFRLDARQYATLDEANAAARSYAVSLAEGGLPNPVVVNLLTPAGQYEEELV